MGNYDWNNESQANVNQELRHIWNNRQITIDVKGVGDPLLEHPVRIHGALRGSSFNAAKDQTPSFPLNDFLIQGDLACILIVIFLAFGVVTVIIAVTSQMTVLLIPGGHHLTAHVLRFFPSLLNWTVSDR